MTMAQGMLRVVRVSWTDRSEGSSDPWEELEEALTHEQIAGVQAAFTVETEGENGKNVDVVVIGEVAF